MSRRSAGLTIAPRAGGRIGGRVRHERLAELGQLRFVAEIEARRIRPLASEDIARQGDARVRRADRTERPRRLDRVLEQRLDRHVGVGDAIDEGRVGAVLEQTSHEIGEQRVVGAYRRIDAARPTPALVVDDLVVERLAHAVQALELVLPGVEIAARHRVDRRDRQRVVGGELRIDRVRGGQQQFGAGDIGDIGVDLAGEDGEALQPLDLRALDFAVPIGALHETQHDAAVCRAREFDDPAEHRIGAFLIGLHDEADAVPSPQARLPAERLQQIERKVEPLGFFGVDVQADVPAARA